MKVLGPARLGETPGAEAALRSDVFLLGAARLGCKNVLCALGLAAGTKKLPLARLVGAPGAEGADLLPGLVVGAKACSGEVLVWVLSNARL